MPSCIQVWILKERKKWKRLARHDLESRSEQAKARFVVASKDDLIVISGKLPLIVCNVDSKSFVDHLYKCVAMTPPDFFATTHQPTYAYLCMPSGKELVDCIKHFHTMTGSFKCFYMKPKSYTTSWRNAFTVVKQISKFGKVNQVQTSGVNPR